MLLSSPIFMLNLTLFSFWNFGLLFPNELAIHPPKLWWFPPSEAHKKWKLIYQNTEEENTKTIELYEKSSKTEYAYPLFCINFADVIR
jgi:hypothetical protein